MGDDLADFRERMAPLIEEAVKPNIADYGWSFIYVFPSAEDDDPGRPWYGYSVGVHETTGGPEILVVGFTKELAHACVAAAYERLSRGERLEPDRRYGGFLDDHEVEFREVGGSRSPLNMAKAYYPGDFPALQLVWPDPKTGAFPWEDGYTIDPLVQPLAGEGDWE